MNQIFRTLNFKIFSLNLLLMFFIVIKHSMPFDLVISTPNPSSQNNCTPHIYYYSETYPNKINTSFYLNEQGPPNQFEYEIKLLRGQVETSLITGVADVGAQVNNLLQLPSDFCYNQTFYQTYQLIFRISWAGSTEYFWRHIRTFKAGPVPPSCGNYDMLVQGATGQQWNDFMVLFYNSGSGYCQAAMNTYPTIRYRLDWIVNKNVNEIEIDFEHTIGYSPENNPNYQYMWAGKYDINGWQTRISTYVYYVAALAGRYFPCRPEEAVVAYKDPPPLVINWVHFSKPNDRVFWTETGIWSTSVSGGTGSYSYEWKYFKCGEPNYGCGYGQIPTQWLNFSGTSGSTYSLQNSGYNFVNCNYGNQNCGQGNLSFLIRLIVGSGGQVCTTYYPQYVYPWQGTRPPPPGPGGCPYIFVYNADSTLHIIDNNILHRSEFDEFAGQDIKDLYLLQQPLGINDGKYSIQIGETENDYNYFDMIKLYAVDRPVGMKVGITESNDIVLYDSAAVVSTDDASQNSTEITPYFQYDTYGRILVSGSEGDSIYAHYDSSAQTNAMKLLKKKHKELFELDNTTDSLAVIGEIGDHVFTGYKGWAAQVNIYADVGDFSKQFARREKLSTVVIPFAQSTAVVDHIDVDWYESYEAVYFAVTPVFYGGYTLTEVPLDEAWHSFKDTEINNDVLVQLQDVDQNYVEMDSTSFITLRFNTISAPEEGMLRDYVFETNGRYFYGGGVLRPSMVVNPDNQPHQYRLHQNYPNPFNPKTTVKFEIPKRSNVKITVFNVLGQLIHVILDEYKDAGSYSVEIDGANLPSGLYIYRIESGNFTEAKKMLLLK